MLAAMGLQTKPQFVYSDYYQENANEKHMEQTFVLKDEIYFQRYFKGFETN